MSITKKEIIDRIVIRNKEDLRKKIKERIEKIDNKETKMLTIEEAFKEIDNF